MSAAPKFTFRTDGAPTPAHETLRVFVNGASAGLLTLRTDEAAAFKRALASDAAAPELYEALAAVCAKEHCYVGADADTGSATSLYTLIKNARAALAKAVAP